MNPRSAAAAGEEIAISDDVSWTGDVYCYVDAHNNMCVRVSI